MKKLLLVLLFQAFVLVSAYANSQVSIADTTREIDSTNGKDPSFLKITRIVKDGDIGLPFF